MGTATTDSLTVKVTHAGQTRRSTFERATFNYEALVEWINVSFGVSLANPQVPTRLTYKDPDADIVTIGSNEELTEALRLVESPAPLALTLSFPRPRDRWMHRMGLNWENSLNNNTSSEFPVAVASGCEQENQSGVPGESPLEETVAAENKSANAAPGPHPPCFMMRGAMSGADWKERWEQRCAWKQARKAAMLKADETTASSAPCKSWKDALASSDSGASCPSHNQVGEEGANAAQAAAAETRFAEHPHHHHGGGGRHHRHGRHGMRFHHPHADQLSPQQQQQPQHPGFEHAGHFHQGRPHHPFVGGGAGVFSHPFGEMTSADCLHKDSAGGAHPFAGRASPHHHHHHQQHDRHHPNHVAGHFDVPFGQHHPCHHRQGVAAAPIGSHGPWGHHQQQQQQQAQPLAAASVSVGPISPAAVKFDMAKFRAWKEADKRMKKQLTIAMVLMALTILFTCTSWVRGFGIPVMLSTAALAVTYKARGTHRRNMKLKRNDLRAHNESVSAQIPPAGRRRFSPCAQPPVCVAQQQQHPVTAVPCVQPQVCVAQPVQQQQQHTAENASVCALAQRLPSEGAPSDPSSHPRRPFGPWGGCRRNHVLAELAAAREASINTSHNNHVGGCVAASNAAASIRPSTSVVVTAPSSNSPAAANTTAASVEPAKDDSYDVQKDIDRLVAMGFQDTPRYRRMLMRHRNFDVVVNRILNFPKRDD